MGRFNKQVDRWKNIFHWPDYSPSAIRWLVTWQRCRSHENGCNYDFWCSFPIFIIFFLSLVHFFKVSQMFRLFNFLQIALHSAAVCVCLEIKSLLLDGASMISEIIGFLWTFIKFKKTFLITRRAMWLGEVGVALQQECSAHWSRTESIHAMVN